MIRTAWLCLDLVKSRGWEARDPAGDQIGSYAALIDWAEALNVVGGPEAAALQGRAEQDPAEARDALGRACEFRTAAYSVLSAVAEGDEVPNEALRFINVLLPPAHNGFELIPVGDGGFRARWASDKEDLDRILWACVRSFADLLLAPELWRLRLCDADDCGWLFIDASRNRSRRWCDMSDCGNRAKVRRYRARQQGKARQ